MAWGKSGTQRKLLREALLARDGPNCHWCGVRTVPVGPDGRQSANSRTMDHLKRRREGGSDDLANLVISCYDCNQQDSGPGNPGTPIFLDPVTGKPDV